MFKKRFLIVAVLIVSVSVSQLFSQAFLNANKYFAVFPLKAGENLSNNSFIWMADQENYALFAGLSGREDLIDSPLEFALLSFYSPSIIGKRPAGANTILPANNVRSAALKLGAAVFKELVDINYFSPENSDLIENYENMLEFISAKNSLTRQQIEQYYRANVKSFITELVNDEFNRVSFSLTNLAENRRYFITLVRTPSNGRYTMYYEIPAVVTTVKSVAAAARETLINDLRRRTQEFSASDVDYIRSQALLIPAVAFQASEITNVINTVTAFYLNPNNETHENLITQWSALFVQEERGQAAALAYSRVMGLLNDVLADIGLQK